jgi:hypothetical protein
MSYAIKPNHKTETPKNLIFFDTESEVEIEINDQERARALKGETVEKEHKLILLIASFTRANKKGEYNFNDVVYQDQDIAKNFWIDVDKFTKSKTKTLIFAHNMKYDSLVSNAVTNLVDLNYKVTGFSDNTPFFLNFEKKQCPCGSHNLMEDDGEIYCYDCITKIKKQKMEKKTVNLLSSTNYYQFSLDKLGKAFNLEKGKADFNSDNMEGLIEYCKQDVNILRTAMLGFIDFIKKEDLGNFKITIAGQSFTSYRHRFMSKEILIHRDKKSLILERGAYCGGRNEVFNLGEIKNDIYYVDVNSMYPSVMMDEEYPTKLVSYRERVDIDDLKYLIKEGYLICGNFMVETETPVYPKKEKRLIFPVGTFETFLSTPEIIYALEHNHIKKVIAINIYEKANIFSEYVEYFYNMRLEAKAKGDEVRTLLYKLFLNSLYGKFGQKSNHWEKVGEAEPTEVKLERIYDVDTKKFITVKIFGGGIFRKNDLEEGENESFYSFPAIASHVTSYARMLLWKYIETAGIENVYYTDTDSLFVNLEGYKNLEKANFLNEDTLGLLKLEYQADYLDIRGCKDYTLKYSGKVVDKIKGVSKNSKKINDNTFLSIQWQGYTKGLRNNSLDGYSNNVMVKKLKREYTKGIIENEKVHPFIYKDNINLIYQDREDEKYKIETQIDYQRQGDKDYILDFILDQGGIKPEGNKAYLEELKHIPTPYRNFKSGIEIDRIVTYVNDSFGTSFNANDLIEYILNNCKKQDKEKIKELRQELKDLKNKNEFRYKY